jgi:DNA-binding transcriptional ArsR family regulator
VEPEPSLFRPDDLAHARLARLLLLLREAPTQPRRKPADMDRIGTYDFFADNPLLLFSNDDPVHRELILAGFDPRTFSYHSSSQRFANRRARIQHDLAQLLATGLIEARPEGSRVVYELTETGRELSERFSSSYADSYRTSARRVARALNRLSDLRLRERVAEAMAHEPFMIDLYTETPEAPNP